MAETETVRVNFLKPFPLFPLDSVVLLPHALIRLYIFEARYRQMVEHILDGAGQIAMGVFDADTRAETGEPPIRTTVCIGQIARHQQEASGSYHIWLRGICRATILDIQPPDDKRLYRTATLEPLRADPVDEAALTGQRTAIASLLREAPLASLDCCRRLCTDAFDREDVPTPALLELVALSIMNVSTDRTLQYELLAQTDPLIRAHRIRTELESLRNVMNSAATQFDPQAPQGISWN